MVEGDMPAMPSKFERKQFAYLPLPYSPILKASIELPYQRSG